MEQFLNEPSQYHMLVDIYENCTVLFADIAGFTKYSGSVEPAQVVGMLRELFEEFDKSCLSVITIFYESTMFINFIPSAIVMW